MIEALIALAGVETRVAKAAHEAGERCAPLWEHGRERDVERRARVLQAFLEEGVAASDLHGTLGYGYDDQARARYESLLARVLDAERALARLSFVSGTHAIVTALEALLPPGGRLVSATGAPYDTLRSALLEADGSLVSRGFVYDEVPLSRDGIDERALAQACSGGADVVFVQRSRGYATRVSLSAADCGKAAAVVKSVAPRAVVLVDNCYGELVEAREPCAHGADLVAGSLIKNLGGGLAPGGGYVAGRAALVERVARRHYAPGLDDKLGPTLGFGRDLVQGLFYAPLVVGECLAGLEFAAALCEALGIPTDPPAGAERRDVVQQIVLGSAEAVLRFARGLQRAMPIDARFAPEPGPVPGYREPVVMSSGAFVAGATIELSCDAPLRPPYAVYLQGGLMREHTMLGTLRACDAALA